MGPDGERAARREPGLGNGEADVNAKRERSAKGPNVSEGLLCRTARTGSATSFSVSRLIWCDVINSSRYGVG